MTDLRGSYVSPGYLRDRSRPKEGADHVLDARRATPAEPQGPGKYTGPMIAMMRSAPG